MFEAKRQEVVATSPYYPTLKPGMDMNENDAKQLALGIAVKCVRNTFLEELHAGTTPSSNTDDCSDVKVVTPYGEIEWPRLSRINNDEMRQLMKEVVNKLYSILLRLDDPAFVESIKQFGRRRTIGWDEPQDVFQPLKVDPL